MGAGKASDSEANEAEADMESITAEKVVTFPCDLCDFSSNWQTGLNIHMGIKHATIEQIDNVVRTWIVIQKMKNTKVRYTIGRMVGFEEVTKHSWMLWQ